VNVVVATAVNAEGHREVLGPDVGVSEDGASWLAFLRSLVGRDLRRVGLVTSDADQGLKDAILPRSAEGWCSLAQRGRDAGPASC
jgi:transposase-like protein